MNYGRAIRKKAKARQAAYLVTCEIKDGNPIFSFSAAMYELYRIRLAEHFHALNDDLSLNIKVRFKDCIDKSGMVVESLLKVYRTSPSGYDRLKFTINIYHTDTGTRIMVNGRQAAHFKAEHSKISDFILASEQGGRS